MKKENDASGSSAWAWATLGIVFIVFYFGNGGSRINRDRDSRDEGRSRKSQAKPAVIVESHSKGSRVWSANGHGDSDFSVVVEGEGEVDEESLDHKDGRLAARSQTFVESMSWLNRSMESLGEKLGKISEELGEEVDKESLERDIKEAIRDAFAIKDQERMEAAAQTDAAQATAAQADAAQSIAAQAIAAIPQVPEALPEVASNGSFDASLSTAPEAPTPPVPPRVSEGAGVSLAPMNDHPVLGEGVPEWIRERVIAEDRILFPIESSMYTTVEECREELDAKLVGEAKRILDAHVLKHVDVDEIPELTSSYIREKLIDRNSEFDNYQDRPSGSYHQLWVRMAIDKKELDQIRDWERSVLTQERVGKLGGAAGIVLGSIAGLSGLVGILARREKKTREKQAAA